MTTVVIVANQFAGRGKAVAAAAAATRLFATRGVRAHLVTPTTPHGMQAVARTAAQDGIDAVVAAGGDGSAHWTMQDLVGSRTAFGIIPAGSGNDIASDLGWRPGQLEALVGSFLDALNGGNVRTIDVGTVDAANGTTKHFLGVLSSGFDSTVNERANRLRWPSGTAKYVRAMASELRRFAPLPYEVEIDGVTQAGAGMLVCVGNGASYGGGMRVCPNASADDGLLDVTWLSAIPTHAFVRVFPRVYRGTHLAHPAVRSFTGRRIRIQAPGQIAWADGERIGALPASIGIKPNALRLLAQATS